MLSAGRLLSGIALLLVVVTVFLGCQQNPPGASLEAPELLMDRTIRTGMSQTQISSVLGAPKVIQHGSRGAEQGIDIWLFDVAAKGAVYQKQQGLEAMTLKVNVNPGVSSDGTVEVKFDENGKAESFTYQAKNF